MLQLGKGAKGEAGEEEKKTLSDREKDRRGRGEGWRVRPRWKRERAECAAEINSARNAKLIKKKTSA